MLTEKKHLIVCKFRCRKIVTLETWCDFFLYEFQYFFYFINACYLMINRILAMLRLFEVPRISFVSLFYNFCLSMDALNLKYTLYLDFIDFTMKRILNVIIAVQFEQVLKHNSRKFQTSAWTMHYFAKFAFTKNILLKISKLLRFLFH